jgi:hypothetical protein
VHILGAAGEPSIEVGDRGPLRCVSEILPALPSYIFRSGDLNNNILFWWEIKIDFP